MGERDVYVCERERERERKRERERVRERESERERHTHTQRERERETQREREMEEVGSKNNNMNCIEKTIINKHNNSTDNKHMNSIIISKIF